VFLTRIVLAHLDIDAAAMEEGGGAQSRDAVLIRRVVYLMWIVLAHLDIDAADMEEGRGAQSRDAALRRKVVYLMWIVLAHLDIDAAAMEEGGGARSKNAPVSHEIVFLTQILLAHPDYDVFATEGRENHDDEKVLKDQIHWFSVAGRSQVFNEKVEMFHRCEAPTCIIRFIIPRINFYSTCAYQ